MHPKLCSHAVVVCLPWCLCISVKVLRKDTFPQFILHDCKCLEQKCTSPAALVTAKIRAEISPLRKAIKSILVTGFFDLESKVDGRVILRLIS